MRFHILGLPHTVSSKKFNACAYTQKVVKFGKMMTKRGHEVIHYGHEDSDLICTEHVSVLTNKDFEISYGSHDWRKNFFKFDMGDHAYQTFFKNAIKEISKRKQKNDFILPFWGSGVRPICDAHNDLIIVEPGIGYAGGHWARFKIFESYAIYHAYCGLDSVGTCKQDNYEVVIPNYFDLDEFEYSEDKEDYFLYLGRVYNGKGVHIAAQVCEHLREKLIVAGQGSLKEMGITSKYIEHIGYADIEKRKRLMAKAKGLFLPSQYIEPFGGVQIESLISGTPTITSDWGAFTENNVNGLTGYRCRTFEDYVKAARNINKINPKDCRKFGEKFSLDNVALMYEKYFQDVLNIFTCNGWYEIKDKNNLRPKNTKGYYDFLDIGTSDFDVANGKIEKSRDYIFVEPIKEYLDKLPSGENISKVNVAISNTNKDSIIYYIDEQDILKNNLPDWVKGCNSINSPHPTVLKLLKEKKLNENLMSKKNVKTIKFQDLINQFNIKYIGHLKIDTEGHDHIILKDVIKSISQNELEVRKLEFEYNSLSNKIELDKLTEDLKELNYKLKVNGDNLILEK